MSWYAALALPTDRQSTTSSLDNTSSHQTAAAEKSIFILNASVHRLHGLLLGVAFGGHGNELDLVRHG